MQSLPTAAPGSFPGFPKAGTHSPLSSGGLPGSLNGNTSPASTDADAELTGFADLLASTQPAESTETEIDAAPAEPKKTQGANLLLACFVPIVAQLDLQPNDHPLTLDAGEFATPPEAQTEITAPSTDLTTPTFMSPSAFRMFARDPRAHDAGISSSELNDQAFAESAQSALGSASATPQDLALAAKLNFATAPTATPEVAKSAVRGDAAPEISSEIVAGLAAEASSDQAPATTADSDATNQAANFSPAALAPERPLVSSRRRSELKFLSSDQSRVAKALKEVGTAVAKSTADQMPTLLKTNARSEDSFATASTALATAAGSTVDFPAAESAAAPTAKSAVAQVVAVMEAEAHEIATANLKMDFDFGDARLTVRVQMRDGTLQAHFHTDSAALQSSLSREWHVAAASEPEKFVRFAEPSFNSQSVQNSFSGQSQDNARRDSSQTREARAESNSLGSLFRRSRSTAHAFAPIAAPVSPSIRSLSQLNTFA